MATLLSILQRKVKILRVCHQIAFTERSRDFFLGEFSGERSKLKMEFEQLEELFIEKKNTPVLGGMNLTTRSKWARELISVGASLTIKNNEEKSPENILREKEIFKNVVGISVKDFKNILTKRFITSYLP